MTFGINSILSQNVGCARFLLSRSYIRFQSGPQGDKTAHNSTTKVSFSTIGIQLGPRTMAIRISLAWPRPFA